MRRAGSQLVAAVCAVAAAGSPVYAQPGRSAGASDTGATGDATDDDSADGEAIALADLLAAAVRRSPTLAMARADRADGKDRVAAADLVDAWHIFGRATGQDQAYPRELAGPGTALATRSIGGELGVSRSLPTGGDLALAVATSEVDYFYPAITPTAQVASTGVTHVGGTIATLRLTASHPLLRGAGEDTARADQKLQQLAGRSLSADADDEASQVVRQLAVSYWELAYARATLVVDREGEALALRQLGITREVVKNGMQPPTAVQQAGFQVALRREAMLRDDAAVDDGSLTLRRLAGMPLEGASLAPSDDAEGELPDTDRSEADVVAAALARGPGLAQKKLAQQSADVEVSATDNAMLPRVDLSLTGELSGVGTDISDATNRVGDGQMYSVMGGLTVQWDVGGAARSAAAGARVRRVRQDSERTELDHQLAASAMSAVRQLARARKRAVLASTAVDVARETLRTEIASFSVGRSTNVAVFQRQDELSVAKLRLARARIDALEADITIDYLTGGLLARHKITVIASATGGRGRRA